MKLATTIAVCLACALAGIGARPTIVLAADAKLAITSVAAVPHGENADEAALFAYPGVRDIDIRIRLLLDADDPAEVSVVVVAIDSEQVRLAKAKTKKTIEPGESEIDFPAFFTLDKFFGDHKVTLSVEAGAKGIRTVTTSRAIALSGVPKPVLSFAYSDVRPRDEPLYVEFLPGGTFEMNLFYDIAENVADLPLTLRVFAVMDAQNYDIKTYRLSDPFWDEMTVPSRPGYYHLRVFGRLPEKYTDFYRERHYFRLTAVLDFTADLVFEEPVEGLILDRNYGDAREPAYLDETYISMDRADRWLFEEVNEEAFNKRIKELRGLTRTRRQGVDY